MATNSPITLRSSRLVEPATLSMVNIRILLAAHHVSIRRGLRKFLEECPHWEIVAEAGDGPEAIRQAANLEPDVAIIDIGMPSLSGIEAIREIVRHSPTTHILALGTYPDEAYVSQVRQAGARGYLLKESAEADLLHAVSAVSQGKLFFDNRDIAGPC